MNYDFKSLSSYDFEILAKDILQTIYNVQLERFKTGKDGGIDLRAYINKNDNIIVQCKHFVESGFSKLFKSLTEELTKLTKLCPKKYIIFTSVPLSPDQKNKIYKLFERYMETTQDIYGSEDINDFIRENPLIENRHFKLWLTSTNIIQRILHSSTYNQSEIEISAIKKKIKLYVQNKSFMDVLDVLGESNYTIISGIPGIGKTTLAEMLLLYYLDKDFEVIKISNDIEEGFKAYLPGRRQVFYYDDFLGQVSLDTKLNKNEDARLLKFIEVVEASNNKKFILTTREYILNQARQLYEKISNVDFQKTVIQLSDYDRMDKAKILYNHLYFSNIPFEYKQTLLDNKSYLKIIDHRHYSPRIIFFMTEFSRTKDIPPAKYPDFFLENLNNPVKIWEHAFNHQISTISKILLCVLATLPNQVRVEDLRVCSELYHKNVSGVRITKNKFDDSLKELEDNFIKINKRMNVLVVEFHNPSVRDYIEFYINNNEQELIDLCESFSIFNQCEWIWDISANCPRIQILKNYFPVLLKALSRSFESIESHLEVDYSIPELLRVRSALEGRLTFVIEVIDMFPEITPEGYLDNFFSILIQQVKKRGFNKNELCSLLSVLKCRHLAGCPLISSFLILVKQDILNELVDIDDYGVLTTLISNSSLNIADEEKVAIKENVLNYLPKIRENAVDMDTPREKFEQLVFNIENIAEYFNIEDEIEEELTEILEHIDFLRKAESEPDDYDYDDDDRERSYSSGPSSSEEIDYLFKSI